MKDIHVSDMIPVSVKESIEQSQRLSDSLKPALEATQIIRDAVSSTVAFSSGLEAFSRAALGTFKPVNESSFAAAGRSIANALAATEIPTIEAMKAAVSASSAAMQWIQSIDMSPLIKLLETIRESFNFEFDAHRYNELYLQEMYYAKWFPYAGWIADMNLAIEINDIISTTRRSKNRVKKMDAAVLNYYTKNEMEAMRRKWREQGLPAHQVKILRHAIFSYYRREYALTVTALMTMWEGIIYEKANDTSRKLTAKTKENFKKLIKQNDFDSVFQSYFDDFIMYDCNAPDEVKDDVPGRHGIAHGWYTKYPSRKAALNAILFTDFLIGLTPITE